MPPGDDLWYLEVSPLAEFAADRPIRYAARLAMLTLHRNFVLVLGVLFAGLAVLVATGPGFGVADPQEVSAIQEMLRASLMLAFAYALVSSAVRTVRDRLARNWLLSILVAVPIGQVLVSWMSGPPLLMAAIALPVYGVPAWAGIALLNRRRAA